MIFNATFDPVEINKERGVILEEINMYNDNPLMNLGSLFEETIFGDHPLGWNIAGPKSVIKKIPKNEIVKFTAVLLSIIFKRIIVAESRA